MISCKRLGKQFRIYEKDGGFLGSLRSAVRRRHRTNIAVADFDLEVAAGINFMQVKLQTLSRWPAFLFRFPMRIAFSTVLPVLLIGSAPVQFLFDPHDLSPIGWMLLAMVGQCLLVRFAWNLGVRRYESASS